MTDPSQRAVTYTYATRRSPLALAQSRAFALDLRRLSPSLELRELQVVTTGDRIQERPLSEVGGKGLFVKEIEEALLDGRADFAVHSIKDVPGTLPPGLVIACVPSREDPRDVLVAPTHATLEALPRGARVGTSSLRRAAALLACRPDLAIAPLRGNVDTRLRKLDAGEFDAIVLAQAGLARLGLAARATQVLGPDLSIPAPGQGALGIECREGDHRVTTLLAGLHDLDAAFCVAAERGVLNAVGGDCKTPLGAYAERAGDRLRLRAFVVTGSATGSTSAARSALGATRRAESTTAWPTSPEGARDIGLELGRRLLGDG